MAASRRAVIGHVGIIRGSKAIIAIFLQAGATDILIIVGTEGASLCVAASYLVSVAFPEHEAPPNSAC